MFIQYRKVNNKLIKIQDNIRSDELNKKFWEVGRKDKVFSNWEDGDILYIGENTILNPILKNGEIREMTREEQILILGDTTLLLSGEYINKGKILKKEIPENLISPIWDKEKKVWEEGIVKEQVIELRKNKIIEYEKLEEEKKLLEGSKFSSEDEIKIIIEKMTVLEGDINNLQEKIKLL